MTGGSGYSNLGLNTFNSDNATYDLTTSTLAHINNLSGDGINLTLKINSTVASAVANFSGNGTNDQLVTSDATLDLSHSSVSGFAVVSANASGTTFTVQDVGTAFQIAGGPGQDTVVANGFAFSVDQRNAIFGTASIEKIIDASGTYTAPPPNPSVFTLTTGPDTFAGGPEDDTVNGTAATLNAGDLLTGGGGNDVLASSAAACSVSINWRRSPASRPSPSTILPAVLPLFFSAISRLQSLDTGAGMKMCAWGVGPSRSTVVPATTGYTVIHHQIGTRETRSTAAQDIATWA